MAVRSSNKVLAEATGMATQEIFCKGLSPVFALVPHFIFFHLRLRMCRLAALSLLGGELHA